MTKRKIALVEDNADNRLLIEVIFDGKYDLTQYESGIEAIQKIGENIPDIILLDISLPEMDGSEVLEILRERPEFKGIPAVALTAHAMDGDREKFLAMGFDGYLSKPIIDEDALFKLIDDLLA